MLHIVPVRRIQCYISSLSETSNATYRDRNYSTPWMILSMYNTLTMAETLLVTCCLPVRNTSVLHFGPNLFLLSEKSDVTFRPSFQKQDTPWKAMSDIWMLLTDPCQKKAILHTCNRSWQILTLNHTSEPSVCNVLSLNYKKINVL